MNCKGFGKKRSLANLRYYSGICRGGTEESHEKLSQDSQSPGGGLKPGPVEYEAGVLTTTFGSAP